MNPLDKLIANFPWLASKWGRFTLLMLCLADVYVGYVEKGALAASAGVAAVFWAILVIWTTPKKSASTKSAAVKPPKLRKKK
ncbi:MAG TPA: hypothetical protein VME66_03900 [Candidatus Acidoferrales bacterium]|nr:hypothetical protein [Candidatus Acidoferrales bacterium]